MTGLPDDQSAENDLKRRIAVQNEKTKLTATAANNTAVTLFAGGVVLPIVALSFPLTTAPPPGSITYLTLSVWALAAIGIHGWARSIMNGLRWCRVTLFCSSRPRPSHS